MVSLTPNLTTIADANVGTGNFTLTAVFNETMNTLQNPTIAFPTAGEDPTAPPATLTLQSGSWTTDTTYVATYNVADQNVAMPQVDVSVSGTEDPVGHAQVAFTGTDVFGIDTTNPTVASITPSVTTIGDANAGSQGFASPWPSARR